MVRRLRAHFAFRRAEYLQRELAIVGYDGQAEAVQRYDEAVARWLELDGRETFVCPRRRETFRPTTRPWHLDYWRDDRTCSYCGSMHPDDFMDGARAGWEIGPTDKNYKAYMALRTDSDHGYTSKVYFQHLSREDREEFADLLNLGKLNVGYPGQFYRRPFFLARQEAA